MGKAKKRPRRIVRGQILKLFIFLILLLHILLNILQINLLFLTSHISLDR